MTEQLVIIVIVVFVLVLLDGLRRKWSDKRDRVVLKIDKSLPRADLPDDELFVPELPNGGARTLPRSSDVVRPAKPAPKLKSLQKRREHLKPENVPVLLDTVELEEENIEHTNVFADSSSTPAGEPADYSVDTTLAMDEEAEEEDTMGMYEEEVDEFIEGLDDESDVVSRHRVKGQGDDDDDEDWDDEIEDEEDEDDELWDETWQDGEDDDEEDDDEDEDDLDDDFDDEDEEEDDEEDDDEEEDDDYEEFPNDFGDYEEEDEASNELVVESHNLESRNKESRRVEPAFGKDELDTYEFEGNDEPEFDDTRRAAGASAQGNAVSGALKSAFGAGFLSKKDQGELFREESGTAAASAHAPVHAGPQEVIIINVMARPGKNFEGYELLPVLQLQGLRLGDMSIFHKHSGSNASGSVVYSMANMVKPGTFDLATMDTFTTPGVSFFLQIPNKYGNMASFDQMLTAANALKHALDGEIKDEHRSVFTRQTMEHYKQRIRDFELKLLSRK